MLEDSNYLTQNQGEQVTSNLLGTRHSLVFLCRRWVQSYFRHQFLKKTGLKKTDNILDFGSGPGVFTNYLHYLGYSDVSNLEPSQVSRNQSLEHNPNIANFESIEDIIKCDLSFDIVTLFFVHAYINDRIQTYKSICSIIKPGGKLFIEVNNNKSFYNRLKKDDVSQKWKIDSSDIEGFTLKKVHKGYIDTFIFEFERNSIVKNALKLLLSLILRTFGNSQSLVFEFRKNDSPT